MPRRAESSYLEDLRYSSLGRGEGNNSGDSTTGICLSARGPSRYDVPTCAQDDSFRSLTALGGLENTQITAPIDTVASYSHHDEKLREKLDEHLSTLRRQGLITSWNDRKIGPGRDFELQIDSHLETADLVLLLISAKFIASDYCWGQEMTKALQRHDAGQTRVIPVILRPCDWRYTPFGKLSVLPTDGRPVTSRSWPNIDAAFHNVAEGVRKVVEDLISTHEKAGFR